MVIGNQDGRSLYREHLHRRELNVKGGGVCGPIASWAVSAKYSWLSETIARHWIRLARESSQCCDRKICSSRSGMRILCLPRGLLAGSREVRRVQSSVKVLTERRNIFSRISFFNWPYILLRCLFWASAGSAWANRARFCDTNKPVGVSSPCFEASVSRYIWYTDGVELLMQTHDEWLPWRRSTFLWQLLCPSTRYRRFPGITVGEHSHRWCLPLPKKSALTRKSLTAFLVQVPLWLDIVWNASPELPAVCCWWAIAVVLPSVPSLWLDSSSAPIWWRFTFAFFLLFLEKLHDFIHCSWRPLRFYSPSVEVLEFLFTEQFALFFMEAPAFLYAVCTITRDFVVAVFEP